MANRQCRLSTSLIPASNSNCCANPDSQLQLDLLRMFLNLPVEDDGSSTFSLSFRTSLERLLDSCNDEHPALTDQVVNLGMLLLEVGNRSSRKKSSKHNSSAWPLPPDLTIKVFSVLDTRSLCFAATTCSMFRKCSMDPLCYTNINLLTTVPKVNNAVVATMVQRAGKALQSLKLGVVPNQNGAVDPCQSLDSLMKPVDVSNYSLKDKRNQGKVASILTRSCLDPLSNDSGFSGMLLRRLHLYNIDRIDSASLQSALSVCSSLLDLEVVGLHVEMRYVLTSVSMHCPVIERLFLECLKTGRDDSFKSLSCAGLISNCPDISYLILRGFKLHDNKIRTLIKGFRKLKYIDLSTSYSVSGAFLRGLGGNAGGNLLEVLILRDCMHLKEVEVARLFAAVIAGNFTLLQFIDISNREGLASDIDWYHRCYNLSIIPTKQVIEARPHMLLLAEFPTNDSFTDMEQMLDQECSETSWHSHMSYTSDDSMFMSTSKSSYISELGSSNERNDSTGYENEDSSDELELLAI